MKKAKSYITLLLLLLFAAVLYISAFIWLQLLGYPGATGDLAQLAEHLLEEPATPPALLGEVKPPPGNLTEPPDEICITMFPGGLTPPGIFPGQAGYVDSTDALNAVKISVDAHPFRTFRYPEFFEVLTAHPTNGSWTSVGIHCIRPRLRQGMYIVEFRVNTNSEHFTYAWAYNIES